MVDVMGFNTSETVPTAISAVAHTGAATVNPTLAIVGTSSSCNAIAHPARATFGNVHIAPAKAFQIFSA